MLYGDIYKAVAIKDCIVMGDFNRRGINCETLVTDGHGEKLLVLSQNLFLTQHVLEKTRKESTLNLVFSSESGIVDDLEVREEFGEGNEHQSDHRVIIFKMNLKAVTILDNKEYYNKADFSAMITFMRSINWKDELCGKNVERSWLMITNIVDQCKKQYVPKMRKGKKNKPDALAHVLLTPYIIYYSMTIIMLKLYSFLFSKPSMTPTT